jgi:hypothetical protein
METKTLHFFINNKKLLHYIDNTNTSPLLFGISGWNTSSSIEVISLLKSRKETIDNNSNINFTGYGWR